MAVTISDIQVIRGLIQYTGATSDDWTSVSVPLPLGMVTLASDTGDIKIGDGESLYAALPATFNLKTLQKAALAYDIAQEALTLARNGGGGGGSVTPTTGTSALDFTQSDNSAYVAAIL